MNKLLKVGLIVVGVLALLFGAFTAWVYIPSPTFEPVDYEPVRPETWPTEGWRTSTPEEQGMDSAKLLEIIDFYAQEHAKDAGTTIDSISLYRNGTLVADLYFNPLYPRDTPHVIHSCTKSVMSALIGIAIEQGYVESVDVPVVTFFPEYTISDSRMAEVTVWDLLSMQTGIRSRDSYLYGWEGNFEMFATDDWVAHILSLPVDAEPGTRFDYSNMSSFMLSAIVHRATGMDTLAYARENLFGPLGIEEVRWEKSPQGIGIGYARMWLKPKDMAKIGLLYLQQGQWDGEQILPAQWVRESVTPHAYPKNYVDVLDENGHKDAQRSTESWVSHKFIRTFADGYGYQWWLEKDGSYTALGVGGQYITVVPEHNLVMVVTSSSSGLGVFFPTKVLDEHVLPAIVSDGPLAPNEDAQRALAAAAGPPVLESEPRPVPELPGIAQEISGRTYSLDENHWNLDNFQLTFGPGSDDAAFSYTAKVSDAVEFQVGLDGVYRFSDTEIGAFAALGSWTSPDTFEIRFRQIGYTSDGKFVLTFDADRIVVQETSQTGTTTFSGVMQ